MNTRGAPHPARFLTLLFCGSAALYLVGFVLPYNLFVYADAAPISLGQIAQRARGPAAVFLLVMAALFALYLLAYRTCRGHSDRRLATLVVAYGLLMALLLAFVYPIGAGDVVDYVTHGEELAFQGQNPLVIPPAQVPDMTFAHHSAYRFTPPNYGPLWMWISAIVVGTLGRGSLALNLLGFKLVAIAAYVGLAALIYTILQKREPAFALPGLVFFAWNPLILYEFAVNGHNDAVMMVLALLGVWLWMERRPLLMAMALALSVMIKVPTFLLFPLFLLASARQEPAGRPFWRTLVSGGGVAAAAVGILYLSLPQPAAALANLSQRSGLFTHSLPTVVNLALQLAGVAAERAQHATRWLALAALGVWYLVQLWRTWQTPGDTLRHAYDVMLFLLFFVTPWFQPWYVTWLIVLAALRPRPAAPTQAGLFSATVVTSYIVYGFVWFWTTRVANWGNCMGINLIAVSATFLIPWGYSVRRGWLERKM